MDEDEFKSTLALAISRLPDVVRVDLASRDPSVRKIAEETLVARIVAVICEKEKAN